jgi:hypothetical protein
MNMTNVLPFPRRSLSAEPEAPPAAEPLAALGENFDAEVLAIALVAAARTSFGAQYCMLRLQLVPELRRIAEAIVALRQASYNLMLSRRLLRAQVDAAASWLCLAHAIRPEAASAAIMQALAMLAGPVNQALGGRVIVVAAAARSA